MLVVVGKATRNETNGDVELFLREFEQMIGKHKQFVYAWSFNPDEKAIQYLRRCLNRQDDVFLYLPEDQGLSYLRMRVSDFRHHRGTNGMACPEEWAAYCIEKLSGLRTFPKERPAPIHLWFLIGTIEHLPRPINLHTTFRSVFPQKYKSWGPNYFAFFCSR